MQFDLWTLLFQIVNFAVLVWLLHRFLYKPVLAVLDRRRAEVEALAEATREVETERTDIEREEEAIKASASEARNAALEEAHRQIARERDEALAAARAERKSMLDDGRERIRAEREAALRDLEHHAVGLAAELAGKLLTELSGPSITAALLDRAVSGLEQLGPDKRDELKEALDGDPVVVRTFEDLAPEARDQATDRIRAVLGPAAQVDFQVDPELLGGAELHFPLFDLAMSVRGALKTAQAELESDVVP